MKINKKSILTISDWIFPPKIFQLLTHYHLPAVNFFLKHQSVLKKNQEVKNRHSGERCFILCNGPSVKQQDIRPLKHEVVFSVSNGYYHPDYCEISPRYHCVPQITYATSSKEKTIKWFRQMHEGIINAEIFLDGQEYNLVKRQNLFSGRNVHFVCMGKNNFFSSAIPELSKMIPRVQSVPIMAIMIALYMGFKEIYLLGVDNDWFVKKEYQYFFDRSKLNWQDIGTRVDGKIEWSFLELLPSVMRLWSQYYSLKKVSEQVGAKIYNATFGGMLDVFEVVNFEDVCKKRFAL